MGDLTPDDDPAASFISEKDLVRRGEGFAPLGHAARPHATASQRPLPRHETFEYVREVETPMPPRDTLDESIAPARRERALDGPMHRVPLGWLAALGMLRAALRRVASAIRFVLVAAWARSRTLRVRPAYWMGVARSLRTGTTQWTQRLVHSKPSVSSALGAMRTHQWSSHEIAATAFMAGLAIGGLVIGGAGYSTPGSGGSVAAASVAPQPAIGRVESVNATVAGTAAVAGTQGPARPEIAPTSGTAANPPATRSTPAAVGASLERPAATRRVAPAAPARRAAARPAGARRPAVTGFRGSLAIQSKPEGATVFINGRAVGTTPLLLANQTIGSRAVRIALAGYEPWTAAARVVANQRSTVSATLRATGPGVASNPGGGP
jgi:hypothetical protein